MSRLSQSHRKSQKSSEESESMSRPLPSCAICGSELDVLWGRDTPYGNVQRVVCEHGHWYDRQA
jgi:hypothetical protein